MKKVIYLLLAVAAVISFSLISPGKTGPQVAQAFQPTTFVIFEVTGVSLAPLDQTHQITDTATVMVTVSGVGCVLIEDFVTQPTDSNCRLPIAAPASPTPPENTSPFRSVPGDVRVVSGPHQGLDLPFAAPFNFTPFLSLTTEQTFTLQSQVVLSYNDSDHAIGTDNLQASALAEFFEAGLPVDAPTTQIQLIPDTVTSTLVNVRWIKTGAIDTGIFVRRTPVVEQAAAPAAPAVQAPATGTGRITAPNTGDAGLQASGNSSSGLALPLAIALGLAGLGGAFVLHRRRRAA